MISCPKHVVCNCILKEKIKTLEQVLDTYQTIEKRLRLDLRHLALLSSTEKESEYPHTLHVDIPDTLDNMLRSLDLIELSLCKLHRKVACQCGMN
jgi:hypothetical protein